MARKPSRRIPRLQTYRPLLDRLIFGFALLGVLTSIHLNIQQSRGFDQGCFGFSASQQVEETFDCGAVTESAASTIFGISNSVWGLVFYLALAVLTAAAAFNWGNRLSQYKSARALTVLVGFLYSLYLVYYQFFGIGELCALCLTSAGITTILFALVAIDYSKPSKPITSEPEAMPVKPKSEMAFMGALVVLVGVLIGADFAYFNSIDTAEPFAGAADEATQTASEQPRSANVADALPADCRYDPERGPIQNYSELVNFFDPTKGDPNAPVTVIEYFDPNCPHCRSVHPVMEDVVETHADEARFVFKPFVLWEHSIAQSEALYAAAQEGKFFEMLEGQYGMQQPQTGLSEAQLRGIAEDIGLDPDVLMQRVNSGIYRSTLAQDKRKAVDAGVSSTPTVLINGRFVEPTSRTADCLRNMIEQAAQS